MARIRGSASFGLSTWRPVFYDNPCVGRLRIVRVFSRAEGLYWEHEKMMRLRCKARDGTLSAMQICFWSPAGTEGTLQLDPRWLTRVHDEPEKTRLLEEAAPLIDDLMSRVLQGSQLRAYKDNTRYFEGHRWLYQMILLHNAVGVVRSNDEQS